MAKLVDTTEWREFRVGDLFSIDKGFRLTKKNQRDGDNRFVGSSAGNNGITGYVGNDEHLFAGDALTVAYNGSVGESFYQDGPFWASDDVNVLRHLDGRVFGADAALFIATLMRWFGKSFDFNYKWNLMEMRETELVLPAKRIVEPDWARLLISLTPPHVGNWVGGVDMSKIDTTGWKEFRVGDICDVLLSHDDLQPKKLDEGDVRLVSAGMTDNGIVMKCDAGGAELFEAGCVTVDMFGQCFWQDEPFAAVSHGRVNILRFKDAVGDDAGKAFVTVLNTKLCGRYSFGEMCSQKRLQDEIVLLPAIETYEPDWDYMEQYMSSVMEEMRPVAEELHHLDVSTHKVDTHEWKMFCIGDLFSVENTKCVVTRDIIPDSGDVPYVTAAAGNNGVFTYVDAKGHEVNKGGCLFIGGKTSTVSYQENDFLSNDSHNLVLRHELLSGPSGRFIASFLTVVLEQRFSWGDAASKAKVEALQIPLPVDSDGDPDWDYMSHTHTHICEEMRPLAETLFRLRG